MRRSAGLAIGGILLVLTPACSDRVAGPVDEPLQEEARLLPELIVSDAGGGRDWQHSTAAAAASLPLAYVALPPGSLPTVETAGIRNLAGSGPGVTVPVVDGGFDPVAVPAAAGDLLELTLTHATGAVSVVYSRVPPKRPPVVVRTYPTKGRTDVALAVIPTVIFSEPIDAGTLATGVRLFRGEEEVPVGVELGASPWEARVMPLTELEPGTDYELRITRDVQDLAGDALESALTIPFTTQAAPLPLASWGDSRIAFISVQAGAFEILVGNPDGTIKQLERRPFGGCVVGSPDSPRLSPDGMRVLFATDVMGPADICVTAVDGSSERALGIWGSVAWSADGTRVLLLDRTGFSTVDLDGSGAELLLSIDDLPWPGAQRDPNSGPEYPDWSVDGTIAFQWWRADGTASPQIWLMDEDGSRIRRVGDPGLDLYEPDWSPDGTRIAYVARDPEDHYRSTIWSMAADGSDARLHYRAASVDEIVWDPEWSPDGRSIAFNYAPAPGGSSPNVLIHVVDVESGAVARLVPGLASQISWAPVLP